MTLLQTGTGHLLLGGAPGDAALVTGDATLTYAQLAAAVEERRAALGPGRGLVLLEAGNDVATVVTYLAALAGQHPVLLVPPGADHTALVRTYAPEVLATGHGLTHAGAGPADPAAVLHPDLAVLLSISGSSTSTR